MKRFTKLTSVVMTGLILGMTVLADAGTIQGRDAGTIQGFAGTIQGFIDAALALFV